MAVRNCPLCGSPVRIPGAEINTRYYCEKCHTPFHLNRSGTTVVGEPPAGGGPVLPAPGLLPPTVALTPGAGVRRRVVFDLNKDEFHQESRWGERISGIATSKRRAMQARSLQTGSKDA